VDKQDFIRWARQLSTGYQPAEEVRRRLANIDLLAVVGPTGAGKTTIIEKLNLPIVRSDVTRDRRKDEQEENQYNFRYDYLDMIREIKRGNYVQFFISVYDEFYATHINSYPSQGRAVMAITSSTISNFHRLPFRTFRTIYVMPPNYAVWMHRIGTNRADLLSRLAEARQSLKDALSDSDTYRFILNDTLDQAIADIRALLQNGSYNQHRAQLARDTADLLLQKLGDDTTADNASRRDDI
jgi:guanylate kinase